MAKLGSFFRDFCTPALVLILGAVVGYDHLFPRPPAGATVGVNGKVLGRQFAAAMAASCGDAWLVAADTLEQGKSIADAQAALQVAWQAGRSRAFSAQVAPEFSKVLGEGAEPADPAQRAAVVKLWRDFGAGLKGGR